MIKKALPVCWFVIILLTFSSIAIAAPEVPSGDYVEEVQPGVSLRGRVMAIISETEEDFGYGMVMRTQVARVRLASGAWRGQVLEIENARQSGTISTWRPAMTSCFIPLLKTTRSWAHVESLVRDRELLYLVLLFVILLIVVGGKESCQQRLLSQCSSCSRCCCRLFAGYHPILLIIPVAAVTTAVTLLAVGA